MDLFEVFVQRRSVRAFRPDPIPPELEVRIIEAIQLAPSAGNMQAFEVVRVRDPERRRALARVSFDQDFIAQAPLVLVFVANPARNRDRYGRRGAELYTIQDATIACTFAHLAAAALGLGSCWIGAFDEEAVRRIIGAAQELRPVAILPIGWPAEQPEPRHRRLVNDLIHEEIL